MTVSSRPEPVAPIPGAPREPRWGIGDAVVGWLVAQTMAILASGVLLGMTGYEVGGIGQAALDLVGRITGEITRANPVPLWLVAILQAFLWVGLLGAPVVATRLKGNGVVADLGLRFRPIDVPIGVAVGVACQFLLVPLLSIPWLALLGRKSDELEEPARQLADRATSPIGVGLLILIVVLGAPIVEELFFRGLLQRSVLRRTSPVVAVACSSLVFGITHFQVLQFPALVGFGVVLGVLAVRTGRLGPGIFAHLSFNAVTVIALLVRT